MKNEKWFTRNSLNLAVIIFTVVTLFGGYLVAKTGKTKEVVTNGFKAKENTINVLVIQLQQAKQERKLLRKVVAQKDSVIDSLTLVATGRKPILKDSVFYEKDMLVDTGNPDAVFRALSSYRPQAVALAGGDTLY